MNNKLILYFIAVCLMLPSCSHNKKNDISTEVPNDFIIITRDQFKTNNMSLGEPVRMQFDELVRCTGKIFIEPSGTIMISTPVPALISRIECKVGSDVKAGQLLFVLSGSDFIDLQKDYAETESQLRRITSEYKRLKSLFDEKVGSEKDLIMAESEYKASLAKYSALKMKIKMLGLNENNISDGNFYESFSLRSPVNGYLSDINVAVGQYADQQTPLAVILDINKIEIKMAVFEKDLGNLVTGQKVIFNLLGNTGNKYNATLKYIGKDVDHDSKTIYCYADIDDRRTAGFVSNAHVEAAIITKSDSVTAVPEEAILKSEGNNYLLEYVKDENDSTFLKKTRVNTGRILNGYVELPDNPVTGKIITRGAYSIMIE